MMRIFSTWKELDGQKVAVENYLGTFETTHGPGRFTEYINQWRVSSQNRVWEKVPSWAKETFARSLISVMTSPTPSICLQTMSRLCIHWVSSEFLNDHKITEWFRLERSPDGPAAVRSSSINTQKPPEPRGLSGYLQLYTQSKGTSACF